MELDELHRTDDAVSPVVGVVLMVAVTVVLSATIGTFALGLEEAARPSPPAAEFDFDYDDPKLEVAYEGDVGVDGERLRLVSGTTTTEWDDGTVRPGDSLTLYRTDGDFERGGTVHVVWIADGTSTTVRSYDVLA